jgi:hypothetical protein
VFDLLEAQEFLVSIGRFPDSGFGLFVRGEDGRYGQGHLTPPGFSVRGFFVEMKVSLSSDDRLRGLEDGGRQ